MKIIRKSDKNKKEYTSRIQKGGALLKEMKMLALYWQDESQTDQATQSVIRENPLGKVSRKRVADIIGYIFLPRYVHGNPSESYKILREFLKANVSDEITNRILYFHAALSDDLLYDFVTSYLEHLHITGRLYVDMEDSKDFINSLIQSEMINPAWSEAVINRVASGLLSACRDFGVLEGKNRKKFAPIYLPLLVFVYIAYFLHHQEISGRRLVDHEYWKLFLLSKDEVERIFLEAHQANWLGYYSAGTVTRVDFYYKTMKEVIDALIERAT